MTYDIDRDAPACAEAEMAVYAPLAVVWEVLSDLERWPEWNEAVGEMQAPQHVRPGAKFQWSAGGMRITSQLQDVSAPARIAWSGRSFGVGARHVWELEPTDGGTVVRTRESFSGWVASLFRRPMRGMLDRSLRQGLEALKAEAERRAA